MTAPALSCTVLVPTYRRADQLPLCLEALRRQDRRPDQVVIVVRPDDTESRDVLRDFPEVQEVAVTKGGLVRALAAGLAECTGDVVVTTDDDARGRPGWLSFLLRHYNDPTVGAVGGRDVVHHDWGFEMEQAAEVGVVRPWGRMEGRHHLGFGAARDVHFLKGVNASWRRHLLRLPVGLKGSGGEVAGDLASSLAVHAAGWRVVYDPDAVVDHYPGRRLDVDRRVSKDERRELQAVRDSVYNETYVLTSLMPRLRLRRAVYTLLVGDRATVGLTRAVVARIRGERELAGLFVPCAASALAALRDAKRRPLQMRLDP